MGAGRGISGSVTQRICGMGISLLSRMILASEGPPQTFVSGGNDWLDVIRMVGGAGEKG